VVSAIVLVLKAVQYSADVLSRTVVHSAEQGQRLLECRCTCQ